MENRPFFFINTMDGFMLYSTIVGMGDYQKRKRVMPH